MHYLISNRYLITTVISVDFLQELVLPHRHHIRLHIHPNHHHLTTDPCLMTTVLLQVTTNVEVFRCVETVQLLVHLEIVQSVFLT